MEKRDIFRGMFLGMAVGDAMGHTVDKKALSQIREDYGPNGLLGYDLVNGYADVTSYTQMAAFTANGLLMGLSRRTFRGATAPIEKYVALSLREWCRSQQYSPLEKNRCWLSSHPEIKRRHCLDTRLLDMLSRETLGTMENPVNSIDAPSSLTTAVPVAMLARDMNLDQQEVNLLAAKIAALAQGSPAAYLSSAGLCHVLCSLLYLPEQDLENLLQQTVDAMTLQFGGEHFHAMHLWELLNLTKVLIASENISPMEAMEQLKCTTAPEVLCGALYACATCHGDFDAAMITAVNHSGRSAAVGAITGAVMGMRLGDKALPDFYLESLEPVDVLRQLADDMTAGCATGRHSEVFDDDWDRKYLWAGV